MFRGPDEDGQLPSRSRAPGGKRFVRQSIRYVSRLRRGIIPRQPHRKVKQDNALDEHEEPGNLPEPRRRGPKHQSQPLDEQGRERKQQRRR